MDGSRVERAARSRLTFGALVLIQFGTLTWLSTLGEIPIPQLWIGYGLAFCSYLATILVLQKKRIPVVVLFLVALLLRLPWLSVGLSLSDDAWRYLHDGRAQVAGVNPYRYAPNTNEARQYAGPEHDLINNPDLPTIYPPAAQLVFRGAAHAGGTLLSWKLLILMADLLAGLGLVVLLRNKGISPMNAAKYLLHPLPIIEFVGNGHLDVVGICALVWSLVWLHQRYSLSGVALAISGATKYLTFPLAPFYMRESGKKVGAFTLGLVATIVLLYLPFLDYPPFGSLGTFARTFEFNGPIYLMVSTLAGQLGTRIVVGFVLLGLLTWAWWKKLGVEDVSVLWIGAVLLMSPIVHPWYVTWLIPFLAWRSEWWVLIWTATVVLSYYVLTDWRAQGVWQLPWWVMFVEYAPVYALIVLRLRNGPTSSGLFPSGQSA